jgi:hypothetical protein
VETARALLLSAGATLFFAAAAYMYYRKHDKIQRATLSLAPPFLRKYEKMKGGVADTVDKMGSVFFFSFLSMLFAVGFFVVLIDALTG